MLAILASPHDEAARALADRWAAHGAALLTARDLSTSGWRYDLCSPAGGTAVVGGRPVPADDLAGVLTLVPAVTEADLGHIVPGDRAYVAAEMTAFLLAWLTSLGCPVLNRPTPSSLTGPGWRREQWLHAAGQLGISVRPVVAGTVGPPELAPAVSVSVVGERAFGAVDASLADQACQLARAAGADLLDVQFSGPRVGADLLRAGQTPDVGSPQVADAILGRLLGGAAC